MPLAFAAATAAGAAVLDCEIDGQHVNPANGSTTRGKTGIMKCVDRETRKLVREEEYRDGKAVGYRKSVDFQGRTSVGSYNAQGNRDGDFKQYDAHGTLIAEERYANGSQIGVQTYFHPNGQVRRRTFSEPGKQARASIEYNDRGELMRLRCADKPLLEGDRPLCGFDGRVSEVTFHTAKGELAGTARYENGKLLAAKALTASGTLARSEEVQGERRIERQHHPDGTLRLETVIVGRTKQSERELAKSGQPVRETRWQDGRVTEETQWYLNGRMKSRTHWDRDGDPVLVKAEEFRDNGKLRARTIRDERRSYVGLQQTYDESGALASESIYEKGILVRKRSFKDGRVVADDEYYEDGSRKDR